MTDVAVAFSVLVEFVHERQAFIRATAPEDELEEDLLRI